MASPPSLRTYRWEQCYATSDLREDGQPVDILHDFYIPALSRATHYDRVAGYFTSTSLAAASQGFSRFVERGGKARFVVGMQLAAEDAEAILHGDQRRAAEQMLAELDIKPQWQGKHAFIRTLSLPDAVRERLIQIANGAGTLHEIDGTPLQPIKKTRDRGAEDNPHEVIAPSFSERLRFAMIRLAPLLPGGERVALETTPIEPWPHQRFVARRLLETYPRNHLLCDEVGPRQDHRGRLLATGTH